MKYLLDTNVLVRLLRPRHAQMILARLEQCAEDDAAICSVVRAELIVGALRSEKPDRSLEVVSEVLEDFDSLPFDDRAADHAARSRATLEASETPIGPNTCSSRRSRWRTA